MGQAFKDVFFQDKYFDKLTKLIEKIYPKFDEAKFNKLIFTNDWKEKALKEKMHTVTKALHEVLPQNFSDAVKILLKVEKGINGFEHLVFADYVEMYGIDEFDTSMKALEIFTRSTAEFAIRPFIVKYPEKTMKQMLLWSEHKEAYVRRLSSEGCRPRLPWGLRLQNFVKDPSPIIPILENLKNDPADNVRLSVSNNINDISKDNPDVVLSLAKKWKGKSEKVDKLLKHALRGLLKSGNKDAMLFFGFDDDAGIKVTNFNIAPQKIKIGGYGILNFKVISKEAKRIRVEYKMFYARQTGKYSQKVFQIEERNFKKGEKKEYKKKLDFTDRTIRKHFPGVHKLELIINGGVVEDKEFMLV